MRIVLSCRQGSCTPIREFMRLVETLRLATCDAWLHDAPHGHGQLEQLVICRLVYRTRRGSGKASAPGRTLLCSFQIANAIALSV